jgi:transcriptional regulator with XRE-family HTH domain
MTFDDVLSRWNGGVLRGAQTRLAKRLKLAPNTISQWSTGVSRPDDDLRPLVAKELDIALDVLDRLFQPRRRAEAAFRDSSSRSDMSAVLPVFGVIREEPFPFTFDGAVPEEILPLSAGAGYGGRSAAVRVDSAQWSPLAEKGDYILLTESSVAPDGRWVVVRREDGCRLRRLASGPARSDDRERVLAVVLGTFRKA